MKASRLVPIDFCLHWIYWFTKNLWRIQIILTYSIKPHWHLKQYVTTLFTETLANLVTVGVSIEFNMVSYDLLLFATALTMKFGEKTWSKITQKIFQILKRNDSVWEDAAVPDVTNVLAWSQKFRFSDHQAFATSAFLIHQTISFWSYFLLYQLLLFMHMHISEPFSIVYDSSTI